MRCHRRYDFRNFFAHNLSKSHPAQGGMGHRNVASLYTLVCLAAAVVFLLAGYLSASTERFALRTHEELIMQRVWSDASSLKQLINATHRLDRRLRDAKRRVLRLTQDNEELKNNVNKYKKMSLKMRKQRNALINERQNLHQIMAKLKDKKGLKTGFIEVDISEMYDDESSNYT